MIVMFLTYELSFLNFEQNSLFGHRSDHEATALVVVRTQNMLTMFNSLLKRKAILNVLYQPIRITKSTDTTLSQLLQTTISTQIV